MIIKAVDFGKRQYRDRNSGKDIDTYFCRALVVDKGEEKLIGVWDYTKSGADIQFYDKMEKMGGEHGNN